MARNNNGNDCDNTNNDHNSVDVDNREIKVDVVDDDASTNFVISIGKRMIPNSQDLNRQFQRGDSSIDSIKQGNNDRGNKSVASILDDEDEDEGHPRNTIKKLRRRRRKQQQQQQHRYNDDSNSIMKQQKDKKEK
mmetsp:Transcript_24162/g.24444  ORF Transcript_24162/g.24444 Transcript_24162/m.24444 type:complete len:135 (+) Transcript_24162:77-481(+)